MTTACQGQPNKVSPGFHSSGSNEIIWRDKKNKNNPTTTAKLNWKQMVKLALCNSIISISSYKHSFQKWWKEDWKRNWLKIIFIVMLLFCLITWLHFSFHILILPITTSLFPLSKSLSSGYCMNTLVYKNVCFFYLAQRHLIKKRQESYHVSKCIKIIMTINLAAK